MPTDPKKPNNTNPLPGIVGKPRTQATKDQIVDVVKGMGRKTQAPHFAHFAEAVINQWGGVEAFATTLKEIFDSTPNVATRTRIAGVITRMVERNTAMGGSEDDWDAMSEEDLEVQAALILKKIYGDGRVFNSGNVERLRAGRDQRARMGAAAEDAVRAGGKAPGSAAAVRAAGEPEGLSHVERAGAAAAGEQSGRQDDAGGD